MGTKTLNRMRILNKIIILGTAHHHGQTQPQHEMERTPACQEAAEKKLKQSQR